MGKRGGGVIAYQGQLQAFGSILAGNTAATNSDLRSGSNKFVFDYTLIGDAAGTSLSEAQTPDARGNLIGTSARSGIIDPRLAPLADNGGSTKTHALLFGSPAIDAKQTIRPEPRAMIPSMTDMIGPGPSMR